MLMLIFFVYSTSQQEAKGNIPGSASMVSLSIQINLMLSTSVLPNDNLLGFLYLLLMSMWQLVAGVTVATSNTITTLGVELDNRLSFTPHIKSLSKSCNFHIRALRHIRPTLTDDMAKAIATSLVSSKLDYCNSLLYGCSKSNIDKLQRVQNSLARVVTACHSAPAHELLYNLHWLPIKHRIDFKIATLTFKLLAHHQPSYLSNIISFYNPPRTLRSSSLYQLATPSVSTVFGSRAFSVASPSIWNSVPLSIRQYPSLPTFNAHLKNYYFTPSRSHFRPPATIPPLFRCNC